MTTHYTNTTEKVPDNIGQISHPQHIVDLTRADADVIVFQVLGYEQPILIKGANKITFGRFNPGENAPTVDLNPFNAALLGVSRQHAVINRSDSGYNLEDLSSTNGTWLNESKLAPIQPQALRNGDLIRLGQLAFYAYFQLGSSIPVHEDTLRLKNQLDGAAFKLTPQALETTITPYVSALAGIQMVCNQARGGSESDVSLSAISLQTDKAVIEIKLIGAKEAVEIAKVKLSPWRDIHTAKIVYVSSRNESNKPSEMNGTTAQLRGELDGAEQSLAAQILSDLAPQKSEDERKAMTQKLMPHLHTLLFSPLLLVE